MASISKYQTKTKGERYKVQYRDDTGKNCSKSGFRRMSDARRFATEMDNRRHTGTMMDKAASSMTFDDYFQLYCARHLNWKPSTKALISYIYELHIEPQYANIPVSRITSESIQATVNYKIGTEELSESYVHKVKNLFHAVLEIAIENNGIHHNPAKSVAVPSIARRDVHPLTRDQLKAFADAVPSEKKALVMVLGTIGLRWGEAAALTMSDIDFDNKRITVSKSFNVVGSHRYIGKTKTGRVRRVAIPDATLSVLKEHCEGLTGNDIVFPSYNDRKKHQLLPSAKAKSWWRRAMLDCQADDESFPYITPHVLRHTAASLMISAGAPVLTVQRQLGHADAATTMNIYSHLYDSDLDAIRDIF